MTQLNITDKIKGNSNWELNQAKLQIEWYLFVFQIKMLFSFSKRFFYIGDILCVDGTKIKYVCFVILFCYWSKQVFLFSYANLNGHALERIHSIVK